MRLDYARPSAIFYALVYVALSHLIFHQEIKLQFTNSSMLIPSLIVAMATLAQALLMKALGLKYGAKATVWLQSIIGIGTLFLLFRLFSSQSGEMRHYITIFWGISASVIFVAGLIGRIKPLRIVGLLGLALCLPRLFLIDIQSTVYRIGAFIGLCLVLLVVGYIYNRYRGMIERVSEDT